MTVINIRTDEAVKAKAQDVLHELGLDLSTAINIYLRQIIKTKGIPFRVLTENGFTPDQEDAILAAMTDAKGSRQSYTSAKKLHKASMAK